MRRDSNWYNLNRSRPYPIDSGASLHDDSGHTLPSSIIVDLQLAFPDDAGSVPYIAALKVSEKIVSIVLAAADSPQMSGQFTPLAAVTLPQPVTLGKHYPLEPLYNGVAGYIVFGDVEREYQGKFSSPGQSRLSPRSFRVFRRPGVLSVRRAGASDAFRGLVRLRGSGDLEIVGEERVPPGQTDPVTVAVFRLRLQEGGYSLLEKYAGPCGVRPDSGNCPVPPIETIGGVEPDCDGNIVIDFRGMTTSDLVDSNGVAYGIAVDYGRNLDDICPPVDDDPLRDPASGAAIMSAATSSGKTTYDFGSGDFASYQSYGEWYFLPVPEAWGKEDDTEVKFYLEGAPSEAGGNAQASAWFASPQVAGRVESLELSAELVLTEVGAGGIFVLPSSRSGQYIWLTVDTANWVVYVQQGRRPPGSTVWASTLTPVEFPSRAALRMSLSRQGSAVSVRGTLGGEIAAGSLRFDLEMPYATPAAYCGLFVSQGKMGFQNLEIATGAAK